MLPVMVPVSKEPLAVPSAICPRGSFQVASLVESWQTKASAAMDMDRVFIRGM